MKGVIIACLVVLMGMLGLQGVSYWNATKSPRWEYTVGSIEDSELAAQINALGKQGWELVFARRAIADNTFGGSRGIYEFVFKRRLN